jgi:hypothetical protein
MPIRIGVATVGLVAVVVPLAVADGWGWSFVDAVFLVWLMTPFLLLIAAWDSFGRIEQVVLTVGMAIGAAAFEVAVGRSDSSTAAIALLYQPIYRMLGIVGVVFLGRVLRLLR